MFVKLTIFTDLDIITSGSLVSATVRSGDYYSGLDNQGATDDVSGMTFEDGLYISGTFPYYSGTPNLQQVTDSGSHTTNSVTIGGTLTSDEVNSGTGTFENIIVNSAESETDYFVFGDVDSDHIKMRIQAYAGIGNVPLMSGVSLTGILDAQAFGIENGLYIVGTDADPAITFYNTNLVDGDCNITYDRTNDIIKFTKNADSYNFSMMM